MSALLIKIGLYLNELISIRRYLVTLIEENVLACLLLIQRQPLPLKKGSALKLMESIFTDNGRYEVVVASTKLGVALHRHSGL